MSVSGTALAENLAFRLLRMQNVIAILVNKY